MWNLCKMDVMDTGPQPFETAGSKIDRREMNVHTPEKSLGVKLM